MTRTAIIERPPAACPHCGSARTVRHGTQRSSRLVLRDGTVTEQVFAEPRHLCRDCGRTGTIRTGASSASEIEVRDHLVAMVFAKGQSETARETGLTRPVIQRHLQAWADGREPDVLAAEPVFLIIDTANLRGVDRVLVCDLDRTSLVELLGDEASLRDWLTQTDRAPAVQVCLPVNPRLRDIVRESLPSAEVMVAPRTASRAFAAAGDAAFRSLRRRSDMIGRNSLPRSPEFLAAARGETPSEPSWPREFAALAGALRSARSLVSSRTRDEAERLWPELQLSCAPPEARAVRDLAGAWREPILSGIDNRFVDASAALVERCRRGLRNRRPALGFNDLRSMALLDGFDRSLDSPVGESSAYATPISKGRPLGQLLEALSA